MTSSLPFVLASVFVYLKSWLIFNLAVLSQNVFLILRIAPNPEDSYFEDEMACDRSARMQVVWVLVVFSSCFVCHCFQPVVVAVFSLCWENFEELCVAISSICSR